MSFPRYQKLVKLASLCSVTDQVTGGSVPFEVFDEQRKILEAASCNRNILILKSRQIGCSQICCFLDAVYAVLNPGAKVAPARNSRAGDCAHFIQVDMSLGPIDEIALKSCSSWTFQYSRLPFFITDTMFSPTSVVNCGGAKTVIYPFKSVSNCSFVRS